MLSATSPGRYLACLLLSGGLVVAAEPGAAIKLERANVPAFPGAEGAGAWTKGGRGGKVYIVRNLDDAGPGSFREAVEAQGPRTVLFGVAGVIVLTKPLSVNHPYVTIAGQSAPGDGVCVRGDSTEINTHDVIIRYIRFRRGNLKKRDDALGGNPIGNVIVDHVSASWGLDENISMYRAMTKDKEGNAIKRGTENLTIQWSISSEALDLNNHAFGGTWGGTNCSFHHNLFACNTGRNPSIGFGGAFDFRNNVLFNWRHRTMDGGDGSSRVNVVNNYYKPGPATPKGEINHRICKAQARNEKDQFPGFGKWYVEGNFVHGYPKITADNWAGGVQYDPEQRQKEMVIPAGDEKTVRSKVPFPVPVIRTQSAEEAFESVMAFGGASLPVRDPVDVRVIESVRTGKTSTPTGILETPLDVGGWPVYKADKKPADADGDGIPDDWETRNGLDPKDAADGAKPAGGGYTNLEHFLNGTDPKAIVDYTKPENNVNTLHRKTK